MDILIVVGGVLITVISYFLKRRDEQIDQMYSKNEARFDLLFDKVNEMEKNMVELNHMSKWLNRLEDRISEQQQKIDQL